MREERFKAPFEMPVQNPPIDPSKLDWKMSVTLQTVKDRRVTR